MTQKESIHAAKRDTKRVNALRRDFLEALPGQDVTRFKFVDEMRFKHLGLAPTRPTRGATAAPQAASARTKPCPCNGPHVRVAAALTRQGLQAVMEPDGAVNAAAFAVYLDQVRGPTLVPGNTVVRQLARTQSPGPGGAGRKARHPPVVLAPLLARLHPSGTRLWQAQNLLAHGPGPHPGSPDSRRGERPGLDW